MNCMCITYKGMESSLPLSFKLDCTERFIRTTNRLPDVISKPEHKWHYSPCMVPNLDERQKRDVKGISEVNFPLQLLNITS